VVAVAIVPVVPSPPVVVLGANAAVAVVVVGALADKQLPR